MRHLDIACYALLIVTPAFAADYYIDPGCTADGDGSAVACCSSGGCAGADKDVPSFADGNTYYFRGVHASHTNCASGFDGRYYPTNQYSLNGLDNATLQPYGWTAAGTGETVYIDSTRTATWTQCTWDGAACDCGAGNQNVSIGAGGSTACTETWWTTDATTASLVLFAQKDDGSATYRVNSLAAMTNATAGYFSARCSNSVAASQTFIPCITNSDCPSGETCSASSSERDSFRDAAPAPDELMVRWVSLPTNPRIPHTDTGHAFRVTTAATSVNIRGFWMRAGRRACIELGGTTDSDTHDITIDDVHCYWRRGNGGEDYSIALYGVGAITIQNSEFAVTGSELHTEGKETDVATVLTIKNNWFHDIGDDDLQGPGDTGLGTPDACIFGELGGGPGTGNYTGSFFEGNLVQRINNRSTLSSGIGIILENDSDGWVIRNNVFDTLDGSAIKLDAKGSNALSSTDDNIIYNNILNNVGNSPGGGEGAAIYVFGDDALNTASRNFIQNNTCVDPNGPCVKFACTAGTDCLNNEVENNILKSADSQKLTDWTTCAAAADCTGNVLNYNLFFTGAATAATWPASDGTSILNKSCSLVTDIGANNVNACSGSAGFVSSTDFHITSSSSAKNVGTARCASCGTTDINNTVAQSHGFISYADNQACAGTCDMGVDEVNSRRKIIVVVSP